MIKIFKTNTKKYIRKRFEKKWNSKLPMPEIDFANDLPLPFLCAKKNGKIRFIIDLDKIGELPYIRKFDAGFCDDDLDVLCEQLIKIANDF